MLQPSSIYRRLTCLPAGPVCAVISVWPSISLACAATSSTDLASRTPPFASLGNSLNLPLPRPPAWIWDFTTCTGPGRVFAAATASLTVSAGCPSETGAPKLFRTALLWYSWIFMSSSTGVFCMPELSKEKRKADRSSPRWIFKQWRSDYAHCLRICIDPSAFVAQNESTPHRLDDEQRKQRRRGVQADSDDEDSLPSVFRGDNACERHQQRGTAFCRIQHTVVSRGELCPEGIATGRGEQAVYFAEHAEIRSGRKNEDDWDVAISRKGQQHECRSPERDEHRVLAADGIREPTEERTAETIENTVERNGEGQCCHLKTQKTHGFVCDLEIMCDRRDLSRGH